MTYRKNSSVTIDTEEYGTIYLHSSLTMRSFSELADSNRWELREFAIKLLNDLIYRPSFDIDEIRGWDNELLEQVAQAWVRNQQGDKWETTDGIPVFEVLRHCYEVQRNELLDDMRSTLAEGFAPTFKAANEEIQKVFAETYALMIPMIKLVNESLQRQFSLINQQANFLQAAIKQSVNLMADSMLNGIQANVNQIFDNIRIDIPQIQIGTLFDNFPDFTEISQRFISYSKAADVLDDSGYRFLLRYWTPGNIAQFVGIDQVDINARPAAVTNRILAMTRRDDFGNQMEGYFASSSVIKRRWTIIQQALIAHKNRQYALSIPTLLAQIEGMFTDALVLKGIVHRSNGKFFC